MVRQAHTTLSEVEGVSSKPSSALDSPPQAGFAASGMTESVLLMKGKGARRLSQPEVAPTGDGSLIILFYSSG